MYYTLDDYYEYEDDFEFTGFNKCIPLVGNAFFWYDCRYCGNATAYPPTRCKKCGSGSFEKIMIKALRLGLRLTG
jgi:hypothetical protein